MVSEHFRVQARSPRGIWLSTRRQILVHQHLHRIRLRHIPPLFQRIAVGLPRHPPLERHKRGRVHGIHARHGAVGDDDDGGEPGRIQQYASAARLGYPEVRPRR